MADVVSCLVHLEDLADLDRYNAVYMRHFDEPRPVRTTVESKRLIGDMQIEITVVAHGDADRTSVRLGTMARS